VIFDRSWYNRAGVEHVWLLHPAQYRSVGTCSAIEKSTSWIWWDHLIKYGWRLAKKKATARLRRGVKESPRRGSCPMDLESFRRWYEYSRARGPKCWKQPTRAGTLVYRPPMNKKKRPWLKFYFPPIKYDPYRKVPQEKKSKAVENAKRKTATTIGVTEGKGHVVRRNIKVQRKPVPGRPGNPCTAFLRGTRL